MSGVDAARCRRLLAVALLPALVAGTSCKDSKEREPIPDPPPTADRPTPVEVTLDGTGYRSSTSKVPAGWIRVTFHNRTDQSRDLALVRFAPDKTAADLAAALDDPKALEALGDAFVFEGGATMVPASSTTSFRTEVFAGRFAFGALDDLAAGTGGAAPLEVDQGDPPISDPRATATIRLGAFSHVLEGDVKQAGPRTLRVVGEGPGTHEVRLYKVKDGVAATAAYPTVPAMKDAPERATELVRPELGIAAMAPGFVNVREIDLSAGDYVMTCFLVDADTGRTYAELGMSTPFQVT
jgi:hypothetical protein